MHLRTTTYERCTFELHLHPNPVPAGPSLWDREALLKGCFMEDACVLKSSRDHKYYMSNGSHLKES